jgi:hypothetical protein
MPLQEQSTTAPLSPGEMVTIPAGVRAWVSFYVGKSSRKNEPAMNEGSGPARRGRPGLTERK